MTREALGPTLMGAARSEALETLYLCTGKTCRRPKRKLLDLLLAVEDRCELRAVGCQKICAAPVVGLCVEDTLEWFAGVDSEKSRAALAAALSGEGLAKALWKRRVAKRRGRIR